jgi:hypothetical protein
MMMMMMMIVVIHTGKISDLIEFEECSDDEKQKLICNLKTKQNNLIGIERRRIIRKEGRDYIILLILTVTMAVRAKK